jgi:hypothetical protein
MEKGKIFYDPVSPLATATENRICISAARASRADLVLFLKDTGLDSRVGRLGVIKLHCTTKSR